MRDVHGGQVVQILRAGTVNMGGAEPVDGSASSDPWVVRVADSPVWTHVRAGGDPALLKAAATGVVSALASGRDGAEARLSDDPWLDPGVPLRFLDRVEAILGDPDPHLDLDLYAAEAALLVLTPFLFRVHELRQAARLANVLPGSLGPIPEAGADRRDFEAFTEGYGSLVSRIRRHGEDEKPLGWWLFHRWLLRPENVPGAASLQELLEEVRPSDCPLGRTLDAVRLMQCFHGLRRGPGVCNPEFLELLRVDEPVRAHGNQRVREQRLTLVLSLAFGMAMEMSSLPSIVAEHLGVPHPVDLGRLRETLDEAYWGGPADLPVLEAECHHEAVIEGLREHVYRVDELLRELHMSVRLRVNQPVPAFPVRLSTDGVHPADSAFDAWARFRIDERRARELLTGVQLYKDRDLAIRELYQNALDACRYRRARTEYLDRTSLASHGYEGSIEFTQGVDEQGRRYVECRDNGVGMGGAELRGVFSHAGSRFAEQPDFLMEREDWESLDPPVKLYPNSRFGIGVLSYFMLAEEISVTTCRLGRDGTLGPVLRASVHGPGHLFRIVRTDERWTQPGTSVRLYLNGDIGRDPTWSCVVALHQVLGIAEVHTTADDGRVSHVWPASDLEPAAVAHENGWLRPRWHGRVVEWTDEPGGAQVIWCQSGGALMVDGLFVEPAVRRGVLAGGGELSGLVVNLKGVQAPRNLSADRTEILSDVSDQVRALLERAVGALESSGRVFWDHSWLSEMADYSVLVADIMTESGIRTGVDIEFYGSKVSAGRSGFFPVDADLVRAGGEWSRASLPRGRTLCGWPAASGVVPVHVELWRMLTVGDDRLVDELGDLCPDLSELGLLRRALPSDQFLILGSDSMGAREPRNDDGGCLHLLREAERSLGMSAPEVLERLDELGMFTAVPGTMVRFLDEAGFGLPICEQALNGGIDLEGEMAALPIAALARATGNAVDHMAALLRRHGCGISDESLRLVETAEAEAVLPMIAQDHGSPGSSAWAVSHLMTQNLSTSLGTSVYTMCSRLQALGLRVAEAVKPVMELAVNEGSLPWTRALDGRSAPTVPRTYWEVPEEGMGGLLPAAELDYSEVFQMTKRSHRTLRDYVSRMRDLGVDVPIRFPERSSNIGQRLMSNDGFLIWRGVPIGRAMPFSHVLACEMRTGLSVGRIVETLAEHGIGTSCDRLPPGLDMAEARRLVGLDRGEAYLLDVSRPISFEYLFHAARRADATMARAAEWLRRLGYDVPDLREAITEAIPRIPRA